MRAELDGLSLAQIEAQFRAEGRKEYEASRHTGAVPYRGVSFHKHKLNYSVKMMIAKRIFNLAGYKDDVTAALAWDAAALRSRGRYARLPCSVGFP